MNVRKMTLEDCAKVAEIEKATFSVPWSQNDFEGSILQENYRLFVAVSDDDDADVIGYCCYYYVIDEGEIPNVCVRADKRHQGVGRMLLSALIENARENGLADLFLEVRVSNDAARGLYEKTGFAVSYVRKNFYEFPTEDAIVMRLDLNKGV